MAVVQDWKGFQIKIADPSKDTPKILQFLRKYFYPDSALASFFCKTEEEFDSYSKSFEPVVTAALHEKLSFYAEHKETGKMAGVEINTIVRKGKALPQPHEGEMTESRKAVNEFLTFLRGQWDLFSEHPAESSYGKLFMTATSPEFRGQGIATEMYKRSLRLFKSRGIAVCKIVVSSPWSRKSCEGLGFQEVYSLVPKEYEDEGGNYPLS